MSKRPKKGTMTSMTYQGTEGKVEGYIGAPGLLIHRPVKDIDAVGAVTYVEYQRWNISHIPSGQTLEIPARTIAKAVEYCERMAKIYDWTNSREQVLADYDNPEFSAQIRDIRAEAWKNLNKR